MEDNKSKKGKQRFLSPSFKRGSKSKNPELEPKEKSEENEDLFKLNLMGGGGDDDEDDNDNSPNLSPLMAPKKNKRNSVSQVAGNPLGEISQQKRKSQVSPEHHHHKHHHSIEFTGAKSEGHIKLFASRSQAGKAEDGLTKTNQDNKLEIIKEYGLNDFNIFAVFDGHGMNGHLVSEFGVKYLTSYFEKNNKINTLNSEDKIYHRLKKNNYSILTRAFKHIEKDISKSKIDATISGTTCVCVFQVGEKIICSNIGDSRAIIVKQGKIEALSIDQKPNDPEERKRIEEHGGEISQYEEDGVGCGPFRVWKKGEMYPGIAMSRSIGDLIATTLGVIPEPVFTENVIDDKTKFIIIASDGVWEFLENKTVADIVMPFYEKGDPKGACDELIRISTEWWNKEDEVVDDITVIALFF